MITTQLPSRAYIWSARYYNKKTEVVQTKESRRKQAERERRGYVPQFVSSSTVNSFIDREQEIEPVPFHFLKHGRRNELCSFCSKKSHDDDGENAVVILECDLCPAIAHEECILASSSSQQDDVNDYMDCFTETYVSHVKKRKNNGGKVWTCNLCSKGIRGSIHQERERLRIDRFNRTAYFSAVKLQANCMRKQAQRKYKILYNGMLRLQARCRGVQHRYRFMKELTLSSRSFRIKNITYELATSNQCQERPVIACILCVINNENGDLDDSERQMYRFDTQGLQHQQLSGRWNESFMIYSSSTKIKIAITVHGKEYETSTSRSVFLGQYTMDACDMLKQSFFTGKPIRFQGPLGRMIFEPKDQKFSSILSVATSSASLSATSSPTEAVALVGGTTKAAANTSVRNMMTASNNITSNTTTTTTKSSSSPQLGRCTFDILPISNVESKTGTLEEILSSVLKGARKKWYAVLAEKQLHLFGQYGDSRPKVSISILPQHGVHIHWYQNDENSHIIRISNLNNQSWLFTCGNLQQLKAWYNKLTGLYKKKLEKEAKMFKSNNVNINSTMQTAINTNQ